MCLGIPGQVTGVSGTRAAISIRGREALADATIVPVAIGDYVLVYAGLIVEKLDPEDARERLRLLDELQA